MTKRILDFGASVTLLLGLSPLLIVIAALIRLTSRGPAVFVQERAGLGGRAFRFYKYRTMTLEADPYGASPKSGDDPRLTPFGRFLRETSLDELPQLFNILKGDMTLVGPRPLYMAQIAEWTPHQRRRLEVKPGLTGLAQTSGRGELTREAKLALDVRYVERANWRLDLKILMATALQVFGRKAIYENQYSDTETTRGKEVISNQ
ncbi:MAG: sugar transferase [Planctomycetes bacterium]|nr:sugar transferase [Planctomycetota bacterium]